MNQESEKNVIKKLRKLLDIIYEKHESLPFRDLLSKYAEIVPSDIRIFLYIREQRRFENEHVTSKEDRYLKFQYLSFELSERKLFRFDDLGNLEDKEKQLLSAGYKSKKSKLCVILYRSDSSGYEPSDRLLRLTRRLFISYYKNCGSYDHFRENVSRRYIREFFKLHDCDNVEVLLKYTNNIADADVSLWKQIEELQVDQAEEGTQLLEPYSHNINFPVNLLADPTFIQDLKTSIQRNIQTFGATDNGEVNYVIKMFAPHRLPLSTARQSYGYSAPRQMIAVYTSNNKKDNSLSLMDIGFSNSVIEAFLNNKYEHKFTDVLFQTDQRIQEAEVKLASDPVEKFSDLVSYFKDITEPILSDLITSTRAEKITVWLYNPFNNSLDSIVVKTEQVKENSTEEMSLHLAGDRRHIAVHVFSKGESKSLAHEIWIKNKNINYSLRRTHSDVNVLDRENYLDSHTSKGSAYATLISKGQIDIGVIEVNSSITPSLDPDSPFFERVARLCGDIVTRIEFANDHSWLSKITHLPSARHAMESLFREIDDLPNEVSVKIQNLLSRQVRLDSKKGQPNNLPSSDWFREVVRKKLRQASNLGRLKGKSPISPAPKIQDWIDLNLPQTDIAKLPHETLINLTHVVETLVDNASHSDLQLSNLKLQLLDSKKNTGKSMVYILYVPDEIYILSERLKRVCVSPIEDDGTPTYHCGLFLLSTHVRMIGGACIAKSGEITDGVDNSKFGVAFVIPFTQQKKSDYRELDYDPYY